MLGIAPDQILGRVADHSPPLPDKGYRRYLLDQIGTRAKEYVAGAASTAAHHGRKQATITSPLRAPARENVPLGEPEEHHRHSGALAVEVCARLCSRQKCSNSIGNWLQSMKNWLLPTKELRASSEEIQASAEARSTGGSCTECGP